jgi:hypothetical protein
MKTTTEDARLVMNGWLSKKSALVICSSFYGFQAMVRCRVSALSDKSVELSTVDGGRFVVHLDAAKFFKYFEIREFLPALGLPDLTEEELLSQALGVGLPLRALKDHPEVPPISESVVFMELVEQEGQRVHPTPGT